MEVEVIPFVDNNRSRKDTTPPLLPPRGSRVQIIQRKRTSLFIIMSFIYAKLLVVVCIAYVISEVVTHKLPLYYYEGFFTYLYGMSILFLLYVFCFLLQESACCARGSDTPPPPPRPPKAGWVPKEPKDKLKKKEKKEKEQKAPKNKKESQDAADVEAGVATRALRKRKTSQNDHSHGSFFLRIGAIAFGLGTMVYNGLEFGAFFEVPPTSPCYQILQGVNPVLQMIFTFMQMYFIFMNSRLNIHRFKVIARFGLMHVVATNLCVWIRTLVLESLKEITQYHKKLGQVQAGILESIKQHSMRNAGAILGTEPRDMAQLREAPLTAASRSTTIGPITTSTTVAAALGRVMRTTTRSIADVVTMPTSTSTTTWTSLSTTPSTTTFALPNLTTSTATTLSTLLTTFTPTTTTTSTTTERTTTIPTTTSTTTTTTAMPSTSTFSSLIMELMNAPQADADNQVPQIFDVSNLTNSSEFWSPNLGIYAEALTEDGTVSNSCGRVNIMGTIVQDAAPYLFPFIIEYSLIGAAVIYVMWKHIGRHPRWPHQAEADLERRLEAMLSRRAVALAHAGHARVDCVGASKGLFFGLLLLVGSLICLILFFVLIHHPELGLLAIYLADVSHCVLMTLSIVAIIVGFIRVQSLKFKAEEQSDLNDILLRVSAFGLFVYAVFSVIAGSLAAFTHEPNLLVMVTGLLSVAQVVLQMLFIADVSRRRVHLPEHDRSKPGRQVVTFLLICNVTMWVIYTFETQKVIANPVQLDFYGFLAWAIVQRVTLPLCIFHRFHSAVTFAEIWKTSYKARLE
ncbi:proton channel OtopLc isoform X4 [Odontomachus brunneus]|uniref:proton channel OtopLc isoform X4 n=1 Tax=Odontomachus brunneus TaxID=486640 RepID=UPI0013F1A370|nr:proton channel OtopLc isoform X4 [Odontomachus brunneus]XP_032673575.1 proton channel OtopLc isoform X4 [Odontomachus brunneus]XP_032673577.1 proton channel OtopLc isoform X4 [Odontomachus brunneus]XP_032673578.1 proton channel OtopLc isoform X4 [Odontomachus brunneus]XP_032673579.1 proton channel OtopLc isoform X4 [Odontomachus brunneus]